MSKSTIQPRGHGKFQIPSFRLAFAGQVRPMARSLTIQYAGHWPSMLVSIVYYSSWRKVSHEACFRDYALDSGAFSVFNSGYTISLEQYIEVVRDLVAVDPFLSEVFALDVIGDWRTTIRNTERMTAAGIDGAIPTYHYKDDEDMSLLKSLCRDYPKVGIGGAAQLRAFARQRFIARCFDAVWPARLHGFGLGDALSIMAVPWESTDSSTWCGAMQHGKRKLMNKRPSTLSLSGLREDLRSEIVFYLKLEQQARWRWRREYRLLEERRTTHVATK